MKVSFNNNSPLVLEASIHEKEKWSEIIEKIGETFRAVVTSKGPVEALSEVKKFFPPYREFKEDSEIYLEFTNRVDQYLNKLFIL